MTTAAITPAQAERLARLQRDINRTPGASIATRLLRTGNVKVTEINDGEPFVSLLGPDGQYLAFGI